MDQAKAKPLYTIGYEGSDIGSFLEALKHSGIDLLVDVRDVSVSRKPGFSKSRLSAHLAEAGIGYLHLRSLGDPKPGRIAARSGDIASFTAIYSEHLKTESAQSGLRQLREVIVRHVCCLMCYERDPVHCHRTMIANTLKHDMKPVIDLFADGRGADGGFGAARPRYGSRQGVAAA